jgi:hypothetical protein
MEGEGVGEGAGDGVCGVCGVFVTGALLCLRRLGAGVVVGGLVEEARGGVGMDVGGLWEVVVGGDPSLVLKIILSGSPSFGNPTSSCFLFVDAFAFGSSFFPGPKEGGAPPPIIARTLMGLLGLRIGKCD